MLASTNSKIMREKAEEETISLQSSPALLYARLAVQLASYRGSFAMWSICDSGSHWTDAACTVGRSLASRRPRPTSTRNMIAAACLPFRNCCSVTTHLHLASPKAAPPGRQEPLQFNAPR
jgi:hypothetical protein